VSGPIVVIDSSEIREGKLEELKTALKELAAFVEADEADPIATTSTSTRTAPSWSVAVRSGARMS
jgi:hypothetical protein